VREPGSCILPLQYENPALYISLLYTTFKFLLRNMTADFIFMFF